MRIKKLLLWAFLLALLLVFSLWLQGELDIDRCLDGGGRWDYKNQVCEGATV
jgi:hypothetical protein